MTVERHSEYATTNVFSLNNPAGDLVVGEIFNTPTVSVVPMLSEFSLTLNVDPSGERHLTTNQAFVQTMASGKNEVSMNFGPLDFEIVNISTGSGISCTRCFVFRVNEFDCPTTSRVHNMKVWASDTSDFLTPQNFRIIFDTRQTSQGYPSGFEFDVSTMKDESLHLPLTLPEQQNLRRQDGAFTIHGSGDADVSEYILMAVAASGTLPLGEYVGDPDGFVVRVTYNVDNLFDLKD
jgi:hypothetical protein